MGESEGVDEGDGLVAAQAALIAGLLWPGPARWDLPAPVGVAAIGAVAAGGGLMVAAGGRLGRRFRVRPGPPDGAVLRTDGPYALARHPVYAGLLAGGLGLAVLRARPEPLLAWLALSGVLHLKAGLEERLLRERFGTAYDDYAARVPRLGIGRRD